VCCADSDYFSNNNNFFYSDYKLYRYTILYITGWAQAVTQTGTAGGTYSSTAGLTINAATGAILIAGSAGAYTVTYTMAAAGGCAAQTATTQ
jgi:hypothetical protein